MSFQFLLYTFVFIWNKTVFFKNRIEVIFFFKVDALFYYLDGNGFIINVFNIDVNMTLCLVGGSKFPLPAIQSYFLTECFLNQILVCLNIYLHY